METPLGTFLYTSSVPYQPYLEEEDCTNERNYLGHYINLLYIFENDVHQETQRRVNPS